MLKIQLKKGKLLKNCFKWEYNPPSPPVLTLPPILSSIYCVCNHLCLVHELYDDTSCARLGCACEEFIPSYYPHRFDREDYSLSCYNDEKKFEDLISYEFDYVQD